MSCYQKLASVQKPYQYVGHEENTYRKPFDSVDLRLCLCFPDAYEIGSANIGVQILYHVVNEEPAYLADRVFAPLVDMGTMLKETGQELCSRELEQPLRNFELLGFSLQYELCYTNILFMLDLAGLALRAADRLESDPLIMGGGPCAFNPEPVADFFDFLVIGEGEEVILEVCELVQQAKRSGLTKRATLLKLAALKGIYVPALYEPIYDEDGRFLELQLLPEAPRWVERRIIKDLDKASYPTAPVTPAIKPVHERVSVEIQRGCTRSCRFCQAGYIYRPRRERNPNTIYEIIEKSVAATGINDIGLLSLSSADYSHIHPLMKKIMQRFKKEHLSVSLPSTRLEALKEEYLDVLKEERRAGFTIAPEAGSQRLRNVINKNFTEEEVIATCQMLFRNGWKSVKMYFMIGQPTETDEDVIAIAQLGNEVIKRCSSMPGRHQVTISVSNFVPKPHTPFQWHKQISHDEILRKQRLIRDNIAYKEITFRKHSAAPSFAEGVVARGDRRVSSLLERIYLKGARFDSWQEQFNMRLWLEGLEEELDATGVDLAEQGLRSRDLSERLPWHRVYSGLHPKFFKNEYTKAIYGIATEDCSFSSCHECGLCNEKSNVAPVIHKTEVTMPTLVLEMENDPSQQDNVIDASVPVQETTYRIQYRKDGAGVYLTTLDLQLMITRAFARAGLTVVYDKGMRPRPKLSMGPALPLGVASHCELFDITISGQADPQKLLDLLRTRLPDHVYLMTATILERGSPNITGIIKSLSYRTSSRQLAEAGAISYEAVVQKVDEIAIAPNYQVVRERKSRSGEVKRSKVELKETLSALQLVDDELYFTLETPNGQGLNPHLVLDAILGERSLHDRTVPILKTGFQTVNLDN